LARQGSGIRAVAVRVFLGDGDRGPAGASDLSALSEREGDVLELVAAGLSNEQIAERFFPRIRPSSATSRTCTPSVA
jgi:ATP/maltotriose-dependent transcriptional regulator MalT